jgi:hypothetical protein
MHVELLIRTKRATSCCEQERSTCKSDGEEKQDEAQSHSHTQIILQVKNPSWEMVRHANSCHVTESQNKYQLMTISEQAMAFPELCSLGSSISPSLGKSDRPASFNSPRNLARVFETIFTSSTASRSAANLQSVLCRVKINFLENQFWGVQFADFAFEPCRMCAKIV